MTNQPEEIAPRLDAATRLAYDRTRLAYDRTLLAWVRTATTLITFGFSVYAFFQFQFKGATDFQPRISPRHFALFMITCGLISLLLGTVQHVLSIRQMRKVCPDMPHSVAAALAGLIALLGLGALLVASFRL